MAKSKKSKKISPKEQARELKERKSDVVRKTKETDIRVKLNLDGRGRTKIETGIPFLDHMLSAFAKHGLFDLELKASGDLHIDLHHTNEDVGITLGQAFGKALGDKKSIRRFGFFYAPLGDALTRVVVDISGRPYFNFTKPEGDLRFTMEYDLPEALHMLESFVQHAGLDTHIQVLSGHDGHHVLETIFKAFGRALSMAVERNLRISDIPSTKGAL